MAIKASSSKQIDALVADLASTQAVAREAAIARLTVIGSRAVDRVLAFAASASATAARIAAWRTLEGIGDPRALEPALAAALDPDPQVAVAAIGTARIFILGTRSAATVDRLTAVTLDRKRPDAVRLAALRALRDLDGATIAPVLADLADDPNKAFRTDAGIQASLTKRGPGAAAALLSAVDEALPADPNTLRAAIAQNGKTAPLPELLNIVERVRDRESAAVQGRRNDDWAAVRSAAHVALAERGSRLGLYDLRESLERAQAPLPVEWLAALSLVGDASCLEPIAASFSRISDGWWRRQLWSTFRTIVTREKLTRRHAVARRLEKKWKEATAQLWAEPPPR